VATPIVGRLGDSYGKRRLLVLSLVALAAGSFASAMAPNIGVMIAGRAVAGLGGGSIPLAFGIIRDELPPKRIPGAISFISSLLAVGFAAGIVVAGPIVDWLGYRALFLLPALISALSAVATRVAVPESPAPSFERVSLIPATAMAGWLVALLLGLSKAPQWGWGSPRVLSVLGTAIVVFGLWVLAERRARVPLVDLRLMSIREVWTANLVALLIGAAMFGSFSFLPQFNQTPSVNGYGFGASITAAGHMMVPGAIAAGLAGMVAARLIARFGIRLLITLGGLTASAGLWLLVVAHTDRWEIYLFPAITGIGSGLGFACLANAVVAAVPSSQTGVASGMNFNLRTVGGAIGAALMTTIVTSDTLPSGYPTEAGYTAGFAMLAFGALLSALAGALIPRRERAVSAVMPAPLSQLEPCGVPVRSTAGRFPPD